MVPGFIALHTAVKRVHQAYGHLCLDINHGLHFNVIERSLNFF
jgi:hypothetical protein